jgi:carbonic anhydrase/acetyltransferase-like protein (isoleucine patch superfamily)
MSEKNEEHNQETNSEEEDPYTIDFVTSSAISRVNLKFLAVYLPIIWLSGMITLVFWWFISPNLEYLKTPIGFITFICMAPPYILAMLSIFTFACFIFSKLLLVIVNLIHKPKEGIFKAELGDNDFEFWCLRIELKKLIVWLMQNWPLPWIDVLAFRWFGMNIDLSSHLLDAWCDLEFIEFGRRVMVGQGAVVMSSMVIGKYLIIKKVVLDDYVVVGGETTIAPGTVIGKESVVGAVTCTLFNQLLEPGYVYAGIPARQLKENKYAKKRRDIISKKHVDKDKEEIEESEVNIEEEKKDLI